MHFESNQEASSFLRSFLTAGDVMLVKGSRAMKTDEIVKAFYNSFKLGNIPIKFSEDRYHERERLAICSPFISLFIPALITVQLPSAERSILSLFFIF